MTTKYAVISLSGGMDSSTLLLRLLCEGYNVTALSFDYGQKHHVELERAEQLTTYIRNNAKVNLIHRTIRIDGLSGLLNSTLVAGGADVPEGHYKEENMKETVVPNRNKIFSSIIQAAALSIADKNKTTCQIAMGIHAGDHAIYPDCRQEFRDADYNAFLMGNWGGEKVTYYTPYLEFDKAEILRDGLEACTTLGLDFDEVYKRTMTSYKPIYIHPRETGSPQDRFAEGKWCADYKSASSVERIEAFIKLGRRDPVEYADETGQVTWYIAKFHVEELLKKHK